MWARAPSPPALRAELHGSSRGQSRRGDDPRYPERAPGVASLHSCF